MGGDWVVIGQLWQDLIGQLFSEFYAPLIEAEDVPDHALIEDLVFIQCNQFAERVRSELIQEDRIGGLVAREYFIRDQVLDRCGLGAVFHELRGCFCPCFSIHQGLGLCEKVTE